MSIQFEIPFEAMDKPGVASALAELILALGGLESGGTTLTDPRVSASAQADQEAAAPAERASYAIAASNESAPEAASAQVHKPRKVAKPAKPRVVRVQKSYEGTLQERWEAYYADLPESSKRFIDLLQEKGELTVAEALEGLELDNPKAMGGLTGAMARWAPQKGVTLPFERHNDPEGSRYWTWNAALLSP